MRVIYSLFVIIALICVLFTGPLAVARSAARERAVTVMAHFGKATGSGKVYVELEIAKKPDRLGIPQRLVDMPLTTVSVTGAGTRQLNVPVTEQVLKHSSSGMATFEFFAWFGRREATSVASLPVAPTTGNVAATFTGMPRLTFSPFGSEAPPDLVPPPCTWTADSKVVEKSNLIGQMQDSSSKGSTVDWDYSTTADSTFGVAVSDELAKNYTVSGSFTITNSFGGSGGFTEGPGFNGYVYGHFYRQRYISDFNLAGKPICGHDYKAYYPDAVGDSYPQGTAKPKTDPYGKCQSDPYGIALMTPRTGHWDADRGRATDYSVAATIYDVTVSGQTGYTKDITVTYHNYSKLKEYVCGNAPLPNAAVLWSNNSKGK